MICILLTAHCCHFQVTVSITSGRTVVIGPIVVGQLLQGHRNRAQHRVSILQIGLTYKMSAKFLS